MSARAVDMSGKVCVVTGANVGIGKATVEGLARLGARVVMVCREESTGRTALEDIEKRCEGAHLNLLQCDLGSFASIRAFCEKFESDYDRLDVLINNAATIRTKYQETVDGFEAQFAINHLAPFLLTNLLLEKITSTASSRIVNVASIVHHRAEIDFDDLQGEANYSVRKAYGQSKYANVLFTYALARRLEGTDTTANCLHPGVVSTNIARNANVLFRGLYAIGRVFMIRSATGAETSIYAATAPEMSGVSGKYLVKSRIRPSSAASYDEELAERLWEVSARMTGLAEVANREA